MRKNIKKALTVTFAMTMIISMLTGCKDKKEETVVTSEATVGEAQEKQTKAAEKQIITVWAFGEEGKLLGNMKERFESENQDLELDIQAIPWDVADEKLTAAIAGKTGPDVIQMQNHTLLNYASVGALYPLEEFGETYPELGFDNFFEAGKETVTYNGQQIGVPWYVDATILFYRTDVLKAAGITAPPATWEELKEDARILAARGEGNYGLGIAPANPVPGLAFVWQNGADLIVDGKGAATSPEFIEAMEFYHSFFTENLVPSGDTDLMQAFMDGTAPMTLQEPWVLNALEENKEMAGKWDTATLPKQKNGMSYFGGSALVISKFAEDPEAAARFLAFMSRADNQVKWYEVSKTLPANTEAWENEVLVKNPALSTFGEQLKEGRTTPMIPNFMSVVAEFAGAMDKINSGKADIATTCEELDAKINEVVATQ